MAIKNIVNFIFELSQLKRLQHSGFQLAGWKIILAPKTVAYHNRTVASKGETNYKIALNRRTKSRLLKQWSFLNQWILLLKLKNLPFSWRVKSATA